MCQAAWARDPNLFEGTDRVLTSPLNGTTYGIVDIAQNPINLAPVGGAQFFVDEALDDFDGFAIYWQYDDANHDGKPDYPTSVPLTEQQRSSARCCCSASPTTPTRGVIHVAHDQLRRSRRLTAELAIFADLDEDDVHF